jgi:hypothetical protein
LFIPIDPKAKRPSNVPKAAPAQSFRIFCLKKIEKDLLIAQLSLV